MKKFSFLGVIIPLFLLIGCGEKVDPGPCTSCPPPPPTPPTLSISPSSNLTVNSGATVTFGWTTNGLLVKVNNVTNTTGSYTSGVLTANTSYTVTAYASTNTDALSTTVIVYVTVTTVPPPNPNIALLCDFPWVLYEFNARNVDSLGNPLGGWYPLSLGCDTVKFNTNFNLHTVRGSCNGAATTTNGIWALLNSDTQLDWQGAIWNKPYLTTSLLELQVITKNPFAQEWREYRKRYRHF